MTDSAEASSLDALLKQAESSRQLQIWDDAIKTYQVALRQFADEPRLRLGLAQSYEAKARQTGLKPLFLMALQEYWRLVNANPRDVKAMDGLLAVAYNAGQMEEVMEEIRSRMTKHPEIEAYKAAFKKIETLFLFSAQPQSHAAPGPRGVIHVVIGRVFPLLALGCLVGWIFVRIKGGPTGEGLSPTLRIMQASFSRFAVFTILGYFAYQAFLRLRSSK